jgi:hypothetical protein
MRPSPTWLAVVAVLGCCAGPTPTYRGEVAALPPPERASDLIAQCPLDTGLVRSDGVILVIDGEEAKRSFDEAVAILGSLPAACDPSTAVLWWQVPSSDREREEIEKRVNWLDEEVRRRFQRSVGFSYFTPQPGPPVQDLDPTHPEASRYRVARVPIPVNQTVQQCRGGTLGLSAEEVERRDRETRELVRQWEEGPALTGHAVRYSYAQGHLLILVPSPSSQPEQVSDGPCSMNWRYLPGLVRIPRSDLPIQVAPDRERQMEPVPPPAGMQ